MVYLLVAFAVWFLWNVALSLISTEEWMQYIGVVVLSCAGAALVEPGHWWYGIGLAGVASAFMLIGDLLLVATDWLRTRVVPKG